MNAALFFEDRQTNLDELSGFTRNGLIMNGFESLGGSMGDAGGSNNKEKIHEQSIYGTASAGWDDTYYIDLSLRNDWSSTLHPDNNSYLYGGLSQLVQERRLAGFLEAESVRGTGWFNHEPV